MGALAIRRKQIAHAWVANNQTTIQQLNKSMAYRELYFRLQCQPTLTGVNNTLAGVARGDEWGVVKRIRVLSSSSEIICDITGDQLWWLQRFWYGMRPMINTQLGDATSANPVIDSTLVLPIWMPRCGKPMDCVFDSGGLTDFRCEITWGTFTDIHTGATAWTATPVMTISSQENELTAAFYPPLVKRIVSQQFIPAGSSTNFRFNLDVGPLYRGLIINATTNATPPVDTPLIFTNVRVISGSTVFVDLDEATLQYGLTAPLGIPLSWEKNTIAAPSPTSITAGGGIASTGFLASPRVNNKADERAWYALDFCPDGYLSEAINTARFNEFYVEFNVPAACQLNVISLQFLPNPRHPAMQG